MEARGQHQVSMQHGRAEVDTMDGNGKKGALQKEVNSRGQRITWTDIKRPQGDWGSTKEMEIKMKE